MPIPTIRLSSGCDMPVLGLGTWELTGQACVEAVRKALEIGYRHIDTAEHYYNHEQVAGGMAGLERSKIFLTTKLWRTYHRKGQVRSECERALKELGTDYLDLYLIHYPNKEVPMAETLQAMQDLKDEGSIRSIGVSNFSISNLRKAIETGVKISVNQVEFHPHLNQKGLLEFCTKAGVVITAYSPIARGNILGDKTIVSIAKRLGRTPAQVSLRWLLGKGMAVIPKASSEGHMRENMDIFGWGLPPEESERIDAIKVTERVVNPPYAEF